jgi:microcystin-dependent protein
MALNQVFNGVTYPIPTQGDLKWGPPLTRYLVALGSFSLSPSGGSFPLTADVNFGSSFGLIAAYYKSASANIAASGILRLSNTDSIAYRNFANSADLLLSVNASNALTFNGVPIGSAAALTQNHIFVGNASNQPADVAMSGDTTIVASGTVTIANSAITDAKVSASAAITRTKLAAGTAYDWVTNDASGNVSQTAVTAHRAVASDTNGLPIASVTTDTELGYVSGVTSGIQAQINAISGSATFVSGDMKAAGYTTVPSGWLLCDGTSYLRASYPALFTAIGTTYGSADGTHFNVPNMVNAVPIGAGSVAAMGVTAGATTVTVIQNAHNHIQDAHQHVTTVAVEVGGATIYARNDQPYGITSLSANVSDTASGTEASVTKSFNNTSSTIATNQSTTATNQASSIVQPSLGVTWFIKI